MGKSIFMYTGGRYGTQDPASPPELRIAEAMAYNGVNIGMVGDVSPDGAVLTPAAGRYIDFFRSHVKDLADTGSAADVAVLRAFASIEFNPAVSNTATVLFEQSLIQSQIPFDIIHLVNFDLSRRIMGSESEVRIPAGCRLRSATLESPDESASRPLQVSINGGVAAFRVPRLKIYSIAALRLEKTGGYILNP